MPRDQLADTEAPIENRAESSPTPASGVGCAVRLAWLAVGPLVVMFTAAVIARHDRTSVAFASAIFWGTVLAMLGLRYLDVTKLGGMTADGNPASRADLKQYVIRGLLAAAALYGLALLIRG